MPPNSNPNGSTIEETIQNEKEKGNEKVQKKTTDKKFEKQRPAPWYLSISIFIAAAITLYLCDTVFADFINNWKFEPRQGLHNIWFPTISVALYLVMIIVVPIIMKDREPLNLKVPMLVHNFFLSYGSLLMVLALVRECYYIYISQGYEGITCDVNHTQKTSPIYFWYYVFYLSKVYEFVDTLILCLRKKELIFLLVYHHIITLWLCWVCLDHYFTMQSLCSIANAFVHVFMYYFYACQSINRYVWWKKHLTALQIVQFIIDMTATLSWAYYVLFEGKDCSGTWTSFAFGMSVVGSFLVLFIQF